MSIKDLPRYLRPREKLIEKGACNLTESELLAILLRVGRKGYSASDIAKLILKKYPLNMFGELRLEQLLAIKGIDIGKATTILAAIELSRRALNKLDNSLPCIDSPQKVLDQLTRFRTKTKEHFICLYLNARNQLIHLEVVSMGTLNSSLVHPREVFTPALQHTAAAIIAAHNHPSGDITPSEEDVCITKRLQTAGDLLGISLLDHLIITRDDYLSMKERGLV